MRSRDGSATGAGNGLSKSLQGLPGTGRKEEWVDGGTCSSSASPFRTTNIPVQEILQKLDTVTAQLETVTKESAREVSVLKADLENEKEARRGWQDKAATQRELLSSMVCHSQVLYGCGSSLGRNRHGLCLC